MSHRNPLQFFPTPSAAVPHILDAAGPLKGLRVLEPSAGTGALALAAKDFGADVLAIELDWQRAMHLKQCGLEVWRADFLACNFKPEQRFARVLMNPPFNPCLDVQHVLHAWDCALAEGGRLVAVITPRFQRSPSFQAARLRRLVDKHGAVKKLPPDRAPGATRDTCLVVLDAPTF